MLIETIILAAGSSSRLGRPKQLVNFRGKTLIRAIAEKALSVSASPIVVTGCGRHESEKELTDLNLRTVFNADWEKGMGSSIAAGTQSLSETTDAVMILLCDQPLVQISDLTEALEIFKKDSPDILIAGTKENFSPPAVISRSCFPFLRSLSGDKGLRDLLKNNEKLRVDFWQCPAVFQDIDTEEDLGNITGG